MPVVEVGGRSVVEVVLPGPVVGGFGATSAPVTQTSVAQLGPRRKVYRGATIDLDFKDADIHDLLRTLATVGRVRVEGEGTPIVLAGSLTRDTPVGATLRTLLAARFSGPIRPARTGVRGAAWLALAALDPALATGDAHARLCG